MVMTAFARTALIWTPAPRDCGTATQRPSIRPVERRTNSSVPMSECRVVVRTASTVSA